MKANPAQNTPGNCWVFTQAVNDTWQRLDSSVGLYLAISAAERAVIPWWGASRGASPRPGPLADTR